MVLDLIGGADRDRTDDLLSAIQALSQTELQPHICSEGTVANPLGMGNIPQRGGRIIAGLKLRDPRHTPP